MSGYHLVAYRPRFLFLDTDTDFVRAVDDCSRENDAAVDCIYFCSSHLNLPYLFLGVQVCHTTVSSQ